MAKILVIDDRRDNLLSIRAILQHHEPEFEIIEAQSGASGIEMAKATNPDTVLLDINMPDIDGYEVCRQLRLDPKTVQTPIVFLTAVKTNPEDKIRGLEVGGDAYLTKPIDSGELVATIKAMLRIKKAEDVKHKQYEHIISSSSDMIALMNSDFVYIAVNQAYAESFKLRPEQLIDKTPTEVFGEDFFKTTIRPYAIKCMEGKSVSFETTLDFPAHGKRMMEINYYPYHDDSGKISGYVVNGRNISERKRAEQEITYQASLLEQIDSAVITIDIENTILSWNKHAEILYQWSSAEAVGKSIIDLLAPQEMKAAVSKNFDDLNRDGHWEGEFDVLRKDGTTVPAHITNTYLKDRDGNNVGFIGISTDITDRRQAELGLSNAKDSLEQAQKSAKLGSWEMDAVTKKLSWSKQMFQILEVNPDEEPSFELYYSRIHPDDLAYVQEVGARVYADNEAAKAEYRLLLPSGTVKIVNTEGLRISEGGVVTKLTGIVQDITEQKQASEALEKSESRYRDFMNSSHDGVVITGANGKFLFVNPSYATMLGYSKPAQLIGTLAAERYADPGARDEVLKVLTKDGFMKSTEIDLLTKDGTRRSVSFSAVMKKNDDGKIQQVESIVTDITERKQTEKERNQALKEAEQANQVKDQFIANISHEIRTPLNSIIGFSDLFHQRYGEQVRDKDKDIFGFITNSSNRLMRTVDSILNLSQLDAGSIKIEKRELDLNYIVRAVIGEIKLQVDEKGLDLTYNATDQHAMVLVDDYSTRQAILNLIDNAVKYTLEGKIDLRLIQKKDSYRLSIQDTGIGISEEYQKRIFDPYTQESEGFTKNFQGIGLGLALTKRYLELNDVDLELTSQKNVGSTFTLIFPKHEGDDNV